MHPLKCNGFYTPIRKFGLYFHNDQTFMVQLAPPLKFLFLVLWALASSSAQVLTIRR